LIAEREEKTKEELVPTAPANISEEDQVKFLLRGLSMTVVTLADGKQCVK